MVRENSNDPFIITDPNVECDNADPDKRNPIIYVEERFRDYTGYSNEDFLGRNCRFLQKNPCSSDVVDIQRTLMDLAIKKAELCVSSRKPQVLHVINFKKNGDPFINSFRMVPEYKGEELLFFKGYHIDFEDLPKDSSQWAAIVQSKHEITQHQTHLYDA